MKNEIEKFTKYEKARMLGSRALQIAMGAPFLVKLSEKDLKKLKSPCLKLQLWTFIVLLVSETKKPLTSLNRCVLI